MSITLNSVGGASTSESRWLYFTLIQEVPSETDLAHLDERWLRHEYSKLRELKRKAELYAVEAKQTAQRLSAENAKLREDLNKERKYYNDHKSLCVVWEFPSHCASDAARVTVCVHVHVCVHTHLWFVKSYGYRLLTYRFRQASCTYIYEFYRNLQEGPLIHTHYIYPSCYS